MKKKDMSDLLKLIERLPLRSYAAPDAVQDLARRLAIPEDEAAKIVELQVECRMPDDDVYLYGYGVLLREYERDRIIKCLNQVVFGKKGRPKLQEDKRREKANRDRQAFEKLVAEEALKKKEARKSAFTNCWRKNGA